MQFNWENIGIKTRVDKNGLSFFDPIRKRYIRSTPEEEVRQWIIHQLVHELDYPINRIAVEKQVNYLNKKKRFDILIYGAAEPIFLIECKAPHIELTQATLNQVAEYNFALKVPYLMISNGVKHLVCNVNISEKSFRYLDHIPDYKSLVD